MRNRNNKEFNFDDGLEEATSPTQLELDAYLDIPAKFPLVEIEQKQVTDALDTIDQDTNPVVMTGTVDNAEFNISDAMTQDSY